MLAWTPNSEDQLNFKAGAPVVATDVLYRLTLAFPSWASAILAVHSIYVLKLSGLKSRLW